jgi:hypothetical protein
MRGACNRVALRLSQRSEGREIGDGQGKGADIGASSRGGNGTLEETPIFIYALAHPQTAEVHYIGKSHQPRKRLAQHALASLKDPRKRRWIRGLIAANNPPEVLILETCTPENWRDAERKWIAVFRHCGARLFNLTAGGDGPTSGGAMERIKRERPKDYAQWLSNVRRGAKNRKQKF